jgi:hypothetical protein
LSQNPKAGSRCWVIVEIGISEGFVNQSTISNSVVEMVGDAAAPIVISHCLSALSSGNIRDYCSNGTHSNTG